MMTRLYQYTLIDTLLWAAFLVSVLILFFSFATVVCFHTHPGEWYTRTNSSFSAQSYYETIFPRGV